MGSLKFAAGPEIYESKQRRQSGSPNRCAVDLLAFNSSMPCFGIRSALSRKKTADEGFIFRSRVIVRDRGNGGWVCSSFVDRHEVCAQPRARYFLVCGSQNSGRHISVTESVTKSESFQVDGVVITEANVTLKNSASGLLELQNKASGQKSKKKIWTRFQRMQKAQLTKTSRVVRTRNDPPSLEHRAGDGELVASQSGVHPDSSLEYCNSVLKLLEKRSEKKALEFFEWMRCNGKVKKNTTAYCLALRALARQEDWPRAMMLLDEMTSDSQCELNFQAFNSLIYVCAKRGLVGWGTKWFRMMLEKGIDPTVSTIGMLMGLYQKRCSLSQAEFAFGHMRNLKLKCILAYSAMITIYTRLRLYHKSEYILQIMEKDEVHPDLDNWLVRLNAYSQQGKIEEAETVLKSMIDSGISPNIVAYNTLITGYGKVGMMKAAEHLLQTLESIGLNPDETTYRSMVEGFGRTDNYKEALWYYEKLKSSGFWPNSSNFYTLINLQARHGDEKGSVQTLEDMRIAGCPYSSILSSLLQAYEKVGTLERVPHILEASFYESVLSDPTSCSILAMAYVKNSLLDQTLRVLQEKKWEDYDFEENLYHLLICSCKEAGHYDNAAKIYTQMSNFRFNQNLYITCSMIDIYSTMGRFSDAERLYLKLKDSGVKFDMVAYSIVVRMYIRAESLENACGVLEMMEKEKDIVPDTYFFRDILRTYQRRSMTEKLAKVYYWILKSGVVWDEAMYNCVINCCGRALPVDELSRLFEEMMQKGYVANTITFNVMLDIYGKCGLLTKARKVFLMARKQGLADVVSYNTIIAAYGKSKDFKSMESIVHKMPSAGYPISLEAYNCMLDAYGKENQLEEFSNVLQKMKEARCVSDHYTYNIMINIYGRKGWIEEVARVLAELKEHGLEPDLYSYNTLIKAYGIAGMAEEAVSVLQEMRRKGIKPDKITYNNIITALQRNENFLEAVKWSLWMKQMELQVELCPT